MGLPDLTAARKRFESNLIDEILISHDPTGDQNSVLNVETGEITAPDADATTQGPFPCLIRSTGARPGVTGEANVVVTGFDVLMRTSDPTPVLGDILTVVASARNDDTAGRRFLVLSIDTTSLAFAQVIACQDLASAGTSNG